MVATQVHRVGACQGCCECDAHPPVEIFEVSNSTTASFDEEGKEISKTRWGIDSSDAPVVVTLVGP